MRISSWNKHQWIDLPLSVGEKIAPLIGAAPGQVLCCDSVSVNLFKLLAAALTNRVSKRTVILSQQDNFPSDLYIAEGLINLLQKHGISAELRLVAAENLEEGIAQSPDVLLLTHVNFRTGAVHDMQRLTARAHVKGAPDLQVEVAGEQALDLLHLLLFLEDEVGRLTNLCRGLLRPKYLLPPLP